MHALQHAMYVFHGIYVCTYVAYQVYFELSPKVLGNLIL